MSHFVDSNQQRVCADCGNRWHSAHTESKCQKCATERKLGGQILPADPEPEKKVGSKRAAEKKAAEAHEATSKPKKEKDKDSEED